MKCRCCGNLFSSDPLLSYSNMPKSAQKFPDASNVEGEKGVDLSLYQCNYCGMIQLGGDPVPYYRDVIRATSVSDDMRCFREKQFKDWVRRYALKRKKVLEIGCCSGDYMDIMEKTGVRVYGIEHGKEAVRKAHEKGHQVAAQFIEREDEDVFGAPYDGFYIMNFLEHIPKPGIFLRGILNNLSPVSYGLVEVPNMDMILQEKLYSEFIQDHLLYFREDTLRRILECNGFEVLSCRAVWHDYILSAEVKRRQSIDISSLLTQQEILKESLRKFFQQMSVENKTVAVWGAGHQALANLSLLEMKDQIACIIDSALFKQGKFTPATHIRIVSPNVLSDGSIGAVIVMAGSYSEEICKILRKNYPRVVCAVLEENGVQEKF